VPGQASVGDNRRRWLDALTGLVTKYHRAKGLAWMKVRADGLEGGVSKFFSSDLQRDIIAGLGIKESDLLLMIGDKEEVALPALGGSAVMRLRAKRRRAPNRPGIARPEVNLVQRV